MRRARRVQIRVTLQRAPTRLTIACMRHVFWLVSLATWLGLYGVGFAQDEPEEEAPVAEAAAEPAAAPENAEEIQSWEKEPAAASGKIPSWFVGAYLDGVIVPSF